MVKLYHLITSFYPNLKEAELQKEVLFKKLHPNRPYNKQWIENSLSKLSQQVEKFLVFNRLNNNDRVYHHFLINELQDRNIITRLETESARLSKKIIAEKNVGWQEYLDLFLIHERLYYNNNTTYRQEVSSPPLEIAHEVLSRLYRLIDIRFEVEKKEREAQFKSKKETLRIQKEEHDVKSFLQKDKEVPLSLFKTWELLIGSENPTELEKFRKEFLLKKDDLQPQDKQIIFTYLLNGYLRLFKKRKEGILMGIWELYQLGLKDDLLINNGVITERTFLNVVTVGCSLGKLDEVERFIEQNSNKLPLSSQKQVSIWAKAKLFYHQKKFSDAIKIITHENTGIASLKYVVRSLLLQCFFECYLKGEYNYDFIQHNCNAFIQQIRTHSSLNKDSIDSIVRFIQYVNRLAKWFTHKNLAELLVIKKKLEGETNIQAGRWLNSKITELLAEAIDQ